MVSVVDLLWHYDGTSLIRTPVINTSQYLDIISQELNFQTLMYSINCMIGLSGHIHRGPRCPD